MLSNFIATNGMGLKTHFFDVRHAWLYFSDTRTEPSAVARVDLQQSKPGDLPGATALGSVSAYTSWFTALQLPNKYFPRGP
jgi:hypothetical protein